MTELRAIETEPALVFDVLVDGPADAPLVLLLHGFAELFHMWRAQLPALAAAGYRAVAPSQRGYSAGARPNTADLTNYGFDRLVANALAIAAACGHGRGRFHLVGHDWGAGIAWGLADRYADRVASLTVVSRPHPNAFNRALFMPDGEQARRSQHHKAFLKPDAVAKVLADDARWLRERWAKCGVSAAAANDYLSALAMRRRWKPRLRGIARAARSAHRSVSSPFPFSISGARPTTRSAALRPRARATSCQVPIASKRCPASVISPSIKRASGSPNCCSRISRAIRPECMIPKSGNRFSGKIMH